jgi:hypothetical protein
VNGRSVKREAAESGLEGFEYSLVDIRRPSFGFFSMLDVRCSVINVRWAAFVRAGAKMERSGQIAIVLAVWVVQLIVSPIWLRQLFFGPLEWLWRSLTHWQRQPFRRKVPAAAG